MKHVSVSLFVPHLGCPHTCSFCNQRTISGQTKALTEDDIRRACETALRYPHDAENSEIAFFGGSFTAIPRGDMERYLKTANEYLVPGGFGGIRCSTRPDAIDRQVLGILKCYRVRAVELGAQSTSDAVLSQNERGHTYKDTCNAVSLLREYSFETGLQMMTGLYGSNDETDMQTALDFVELKPDTVRIYPTVVLEGTRLASLYRSGEYKPQETEDAVRLCARLLELFRKNSIRVIRLGLHSGGNVEEGYIAGAYHPAFGELCEGEIMLGKVRSLLEKEKKGSYIITVNDRDVSKMTGQNKKNIVSLSEDGYICRVIPDRQVRQGDIIISRKDTVCT